MSRTSLKVIDLFAGVGGFSLGAARAGFEVIAAVDLDPYANEAHKKNFTKAKHGRRDIVSLSGNQLRDLAKLNGTRLDGLIGGPPCQGFSTMGKMRKNDARNKLFFHFFRLVSELNPLFFVVENVPGILDDKYETLLQESVALVERKFYTLRPFALSAADFGAATERPRVFFIGWAKDSGFDLSEEDFDLRCKTRTTLIRTAFSGLPERIDWRWTDHKHSWREIEKRRCPFVIRINKLCETVGDPIAIRRFDDKSEVSGFVATRHTPAVLARFSRVEPGEVDEVSKFPRLRWNGVCPTLRAGTAKDRGSYQAARPIHPSQNRVITPREAARLQGFPDWFLFDPTKWHSFRQIGNSVSPLIAERVMSVFGRHLG